MTGAKTFSTMLYQSSSTAGISDHKRCAESENSKKKVNEKATEILQNRNYAEPDLYIVPEDGQDVFPASLNEIYRIIEKAEEKDQRKIKKVCMCQNPEQRERIIISAKTFKRV
jgi:hypothetical protein